MSNHVCPCGSNINMFSKFLTELGYEMDKVDKIKPDIDAVMSIFSPLEANLFSMEQCGFQVKPLEKKLDKIKENAKQIQSIQEGKKEIVTGYEVKDALYWMGDTLFHLRNDFDTLIESITTKRK